MVKAKQWGILMLAKRSQNFIDSNINLKPR